MADEVSKVHMSSQKVATKMADYGIPNFDDYYLSNPDKFFLLEKVKYKTCCHPKALLSKRFWNGNHIDYAPKWDWNFTSMHAFCGDQSVCQVAADLVAEKPGSEDHILLLMKQHNACVHGHKTSHDNHLGIHNTIHKMLVKAGVSSFGQLNCDQKTGICNTIHETLIKAGVSSFRQLNHEQKTSICNTNHERLIKAGINNFGQLNAMEGKGAFAASKVLSKTLHEKMIIDLDLVSAKQFLFDYEVLLNTVIKF